MIKVKNIEELKSYIGKELGTSKWIEIDQERINAFADCTDDHQFIHVDEELAKPIFGGTIAHGFLTLSLLVPMMNEITPKIEGTKMGFNYGMNKLRFLQPVKSGASINATLKLKDVIEKQEGRYLLTYDATVNIKGVEKPAYKAEFLTLLVT